MYSVLPELNQTPSMYSQGPNHKTNPGDMSDLYETKFTARTLNDTAQIRDRRGIGSLVVQAIPGLITLAIESVSLYIKADNNRELILQLKL